MSVAGSASRDPTGTTSLRKRFARDFRSRWSDVRGENRDYLTDRAAVAFDTRALRTYRDWFTGTVLAEVVEPGGAQEAARGRHWTGTYVRQAYDKGLRDARADLRRVGESKDVVSDATSLRQSEHEETRRREYLTAYYEAEDTGYRLRQRAFREAGEALASDATPRQLADRVNEQIRTHGENATNALAQTVVVETVNQAKLTAFELSEEVDEVGFVVESQRRENATARQNAETVEFTTAGDDRVCPECASLGSTVMPVDRVRSNMDLIPPLHPNCRCSISPT